MGEPDRQVADAAVEELAWDVVHENVVHLSHEMPCPRCGHSSHTFLPCSERCTCEGQTSSLDRAPSYALH